MRKIIVSQFLTLDGVMEAPENWAPYVNDAELVQALLNDMQESDAILLGRTTYEFFAARWPSRSNEMAHWFNNVAKYVVSSSLKSTTWNNSTIIKSYVVDVIKEMKAEVGKNILVFGSYDLLQTLRENNLIDAYQLHVYPLTLGKGKRLFIDGATEQLKLNSSAQLASGVVSLTYELLS